MTKFSKLKILLLLSTYYILLTLPAEAAKLELTSPVSEIGIGREIQVDLILDAENEDINAIEGKMFFPKNLLEFKEVYTGNSIINFWIEQPAQKNGEIKFSGVIPGGFSGVLSPYYKGARPGKIFSIVFAAKKEGSGAIEIRGARVLLNDGQGTSAETRIFNFQFSISKQIPDSKFQIPKDADPPELFTPEIASDPNIFDGKWFLVFAAQDKISGVDGYFVHETTRRKDITQIDAKDWITAESPHLLSDQKLKSYIYVKAIDKAGNARIVYLPPKAPWYKKWPVYITITLAIIIGVIIIWRWLWRLRSKKH